MSGNWPVKKIDDLKAETKSAIAMGPFGSRIKVENFVSEGVPILKGGNLHGAFIDDSECDYLTVEKAEELSSSIAVPGDIVITHRGTIGQVSIIPTKSRYPKYVVSQSQLKISLNTKVINPFFANYFLRSPNGQHQLLSYASQVGVPAIAKASTSVRQIEIPCPPLQIQDEVVDVLKSLDDKIQLNHQINQTFEQMAQALFKSWFVDFEPVKAKINALEAGGTSEDATLAAMTSISGKDSIALAMFAREQPEQYAELKATAELFPASMQESALGAIPQGWSVQRIGSLIELVYGKALKSTNRKEGNVPVYGSGGITGFHNEPLVPHGSIIVGRKGTVGSLYWEDSPFFAIDTTYYVRPLTLPLTYCYYAMQTLGLEKLNTDAAVPGLNRENVYRLELVRPSLCILSKFDTEVSLLRKTINANSDSSKTLANLRDILLPKLLSGEITLPEAEPQEA